MLAAVQHTLDRVHTLRLWWSVCCPIPLYRLALEKEDFVLTVQPAAEWTWSPAPACCFWSRKSSTRKTAGTGSCTAADLIARLALVRKHLRNTCATENVSASPKLRSKCSGPASRGRIRAERLKFLITQHASLPTAFVVFN